MTDLLDLHPSEEYVLCMNCGCLKDPEPALNGPTSECTWALCDCHNGHWAAIPELEKRAMWGDR